MAADTPLKLRALDPQDMDVFAALLQDALVPLADMTFQKREKRFILVANRFQWSSVEGAPAPPPLSEGEDAAFEDAADLPPFARANCGVSFEKVTGVRMKGIRPGAKDEILNLLTIKAEPKAITLIFAGDAMIRLEVTAIRARLEDIGEAWPTRWQPEHDAAAETDEEDSSLAGQ